MPVINISVKDKIARLETPANIVCNNSDYIIRFDFDAEWQPYETKTARFVISGKYIDTVFSGAEVAVPIISDARVVAIGVYAGDLHTTTPAFIMCDGSITSEGGSPSAPSEDVYAQIMEMLNRNSGLWYPSVESGVLSWAKSSAETSPTPADIRGPVGPKGATGPAGKDGERGPKGADGVTPHIGDNGNWYIGDTDTGVSAGGSELPTVTDANTGKYLHVNASKELEWAGLSFTDDGAGNISVDGAAAQSVNRFLQSLTFPSLNFKYINPLNSGTYSNPYGVYVGSGASLVDTILAKTAPGVYTVYMNRNATDVPAAAAAASSSLRGLVVLSQIKKHYAIILLVDQLSNFYVQYIQNDVGGGWKQMPTSDDAGKDCLILMSSTPGSAKKFKITVDDSGVISATEVTQ